MSVIVSGTGAVQGPVKADLSGINTAGSVPMFGPTVPTVSRTFDVPDSRLDMTDQIKALTPPALPPPPPIRSGGGNSIGGARQCPVSEVRDTCRHPLTRTSETNGH